MTVEALDQRGGGAPIIISAQGAMSCTTTFTGLTITEPVEGPEWEVVIRRHATDTVSVVDVTVSVDTFANSVSWALTSTQVGAIIADGQAKWAGYWYLKNTSDDRVYQSDTFVIDRSRPNTTTNGSFSCVVTSTTIHTTVLAAVDALTVSGPRRPLPTGARDIAVGDSIVAGTGSTLSSTTNTGDSRQAVGGWFSRLCGQHPDRYYKIRNAGIGGDIVGGLAELTAACEAGDSTISLRVLYGNRPYNTGIAVYVGGIALNNDAHLISSVTDTGDDEDGYPTYDVTFADALDNDHDSGDEVGWGVHGRLQSSVIDWGPDMVQVAVGTNDSGGTLTALEVAEGIISIGTRLRAVSIEPFLHELLPRATFTDTVVNINDELRYLCRLSSRPFHLLPLWQLFADGDGEYADASWTSDGLHPSDIGHQKYADAVHTYMSVLSLRLARTPLAAMDESTTNELAHACFLTGASGGGGTVPTGWTLTQFFTTLTVPGIEAAGADDGIIGQWATLTATAGAAGSTSLRQTCSTFTVGDTLYVAARVKLSGITAGFTATVQFLTGTFNLDLGNLLTDNMDMTLVCTSAELPSVAQSIFSMVVAPNGSAGKLWVAQPIVQNLTELERAV